MSETAVSTATENQVAEVKTPFDDGVWKEVAELPVPETNEKDEPEEKPVEVKAAPNQVKPAKEEAAPEVKPEEVKPETAPAPEQKFANKQSEFIYNALKAGKTDEVYTVLSEIKKLDSVETLTPAEVIKLNLSYQHKDYTPDEINDLFDETYVMPDKPVEEYGESEEDFAARTEAYQKKVERIESRIARDAKPAKTDLLKLKSEIVLPDIHGETAAPSRTQEELDAEKEAIGSGLKSVTGYSTQYKDEEVEIPIAYKIPDAEREAIKPILEAANSDLPSFFTQLGWVKNGQIDQSKIAADIHLLVNREKVIADLVHDAGTKRHKETVKAMKNIDYSGKTSGNGDMGETQQKKQDKLANTFFGA